MATEIQPRTLEADSSEALINAQLQRTRSQVKSVEFGQRILKLVVGVLIFFLLATLLDHWVVSEGLPIWARVMLWLTLIAGILWYSIKALLPLLLYRVNPLYAARTIEETKPSLKNSLINYLTLRTEQERLPTVIYDAIAKQAATGVKDASVDHAVDHAPLIRWGYLLLGITFCFALYFVLSPKNPFRTVARVIVPWAELTAPSRVQIVEVTPGSAQLYRGKTVKVSARIEGLDVDEPVTLHYTTADGQQREQPIKLKLDELRNHSTLLPAPAEKQASVVAPPRELAGLQQDFEYYITAGDARSQTFRVQIAPAPYIGVERIEYKYPAYTKKPAETRQGEVNIEALEGTTVTIHGTANQPLKKAWIELRDNAGKPARFPDMKITDQTASGSWTIGWKDPQTRDLPDFASYALRFKNQQGHENPEPIAYPVKVVRDEPPTIDILAPTSTEITVPWDQPITFEVRAQDPDFGLLEVKLHGKRGDKPIFSPNIASFAAANAHQGNLQQKYTRTPKELGLLAGDVIDYWVTATDNKMPNPNIVLTSPRKLRVIEPQKNRNPNNDPLANNQQNQQQNNNGDRNQNQPPQPNNQQQPNDPANQNPMGNQGQPNPDQQNNNGQGQQANDPTARDQNQNNQQQNPNDPRQQPQNGNNAQQNQEPNKNNQQQNPDNKNQQQNGGEAGKTDNQQNNSNQQQKNEPNGNKSGDQQQNAGQQPNQGNQSNDPQDQKNQQQNPMGDGNQKQQQNGKQGNEQQPNGDKNQTPNKPGENGKQNPNGNQQNGNPEQNQQAKGRPQDNDNKLKSDGSQDSDAFQRLKEMFDKKSEQKPNEQQANNNSPNGGNQNQDNKQQAGKQEQGKQEPGKQNEPGQQNAGKESGKNEQGNQQGNKPENGKQEQGKQQQGKQPGKEGGNQAGEAGANKEQNQQNTGNNKSGESGKQGNSQKESGKEPPSNDTKQQGDQKNNGQPEQNAAKQQGSKQGEQSPNGAGQKSEPMNPPQQQPGKNDQAGDQQAGKAGAGEKPEPGQKADQGKQPEQNGKQPGDMKPDGNRQSPEQKQPGANDKQPNSQGNKQGNSTEPENKQNPMNNQQQSGMGNPNGSPEAQDKGKPNANPSNSNADGKNKEQSPSNKGNDSASKGEEGGDRNGGGKQGGGQQENKQGRGASGSNTPDEKGANASNQEGDGETGNKAGDKQKSNGQTGKSGNEAGKGTNQKQGNGKQPGGEAGKNAAEDMNEAAGKQPGEPGGKADSLPGKQQQAQKQGGEAGSLVGGGQGDTSTKSDVTQYNGPHATSPEDPINDAYAKKATDLVLDQLGKQLRSGNVDQDLLNKLGWDQKQAQEFYDRWSARKREATQLGPSGDAAATKLREQLRSLGLRPEQSSNTGDNTADDSQRGNRVNRRSAPPSEYRDIYRAFQKGSAGG